MSMTYRCTMNMVVRMIVSVANMDADILVNVWMTVNHRRYGHFLETQRHQNLEFQHHEPYRDIVRYIHTERTIARFDANSCLHLQLLQALENIMIKIQ